MIKTIELIVAIFLVVFSFFAGVKYSDDIKSHASWLFENKGEEEVELPDLSGEGVVEITDPTDGSVSNKTIPTEQIQPAAADAENTPMDYIDTNNPKPSTPTQAQ